MDTDGAAGIEAAGAQPTAGAGAPALLALAESAAACNNARLEPDGHAAGDPTEVALLQAARALGADVKRTAATSDAATGTTSTRSSS